MATNILDDRFRLSLLALSGWVLIGWLGMPVLSMFGSGATDVLGISISQLTLAVFAIAVSSLFDGGALGLAAPRPWRSLLALWLPLLYIAGLLALTWLEGSPGDVVALMLFVSALLVATAQEIMFRGILFAGLSTRYSMPVTVWITSLVSAVVWLPSWFWHGLWGEGIADAISGFFIAILLAALRIRSGSLYLCIALAAAWEFAMSLFRTTLGSEVWASLEFQSAFILLPLYGLFLLRRKTVGQADATSAKSS